MAVPGYVHLNGCHDSFLPSRSFEWDVDSHKQLLEMFVAMEVYNMVIYRQVGALVCDGINKRQPRGGAQLIARRKNKLRSTASSLHQHRHHRLRVTVIDSQQGHSSA